MAVRSFHGGVSYREKINFTLCCFVVYKSLVIAIVSDEWDISANENHYTSNDTHSVLFVRASNDDISMYHHHMTSSVIFPTHRHCSLMMWEMSKY